MKNQCNVQCGYHPIGEDNGKATLTVSQLRNHLLDLNIDAVINRNIKNQHLSQKGPSLNDSMPKLSARNLLEKIKSY